MNDDHKLDVREPSSSPSTLSSRSMSLRGQQDDGRSTSTLTVSSSSSSDWNGINKGPTTTADSNTGTATGTGTSSSYEPSSSPTTRSPPTENSMEPAMAPTDDADLKFELQLQLQLQQQLQQQKQLRLQQQQQQRQQLRLRGRGHGRERGFGRSDNDEIGGRNVVKPTDMDSDDTGTDTNNNQDTNNNSNSNNHPGNDLDLEDCNNFSHENDGNGGDDLEDEQHNIIVSSEPEATITDNFLISLPSMDPESTLIDVEEDPSLSLLEQSTNSNSKHASPVSSPTTNNIFDDSHRQNDNHYDAEDHVISRMLKEEEDKEALLCDESLSQDRSSIFTSMVSVG